MQQQQVDAVAKPGIVFISGTYSGHVRYTGGASGTKVFYSAEVSAGYYCSGFVVSNVESEATIMTAGHCADKQEAKQPLIEAFLAQQVKQGQITAGQVNSLLTYGMTNWTVLGDSVGTSVNQVINVYEPSAVSGLSASTKMQATVEADKSFENGDTALLQVHTEQPLPTLQVSPTEPTTGDALTAVGYPSAVTNVSDSSLDPSFETGHMNSLQTRAGLPEIQFDAGLSPGMSGGPVLNGTGQVIGINSYRNSQETQQFNFAVDLSTITSFLTSHNVNNSLSPADVAYRNGLNDYYGGKYREAAKQFAITLTNIPSHALAQHYQTLSRNNFSKEPVARTVPKPILQPVAKKESTGSGFPVWGIVGIAALVVVVAAILGFLKITRRKRAQTAAQPVPGAPYPHPQQYGGYPDPTAPAYPMPQQYAEVSPPSTSTALLPQMETRCSNCGTVYSGDTKFCSKDGSQLSG